MLGLGALEAGLGFLVPTLTITAGNLLGEGLVPRFGVRTVLIGGLSVGAAGAALLTPAMNASGTYLGALPGLVGFGLGLCVVFPSMFAAASTGIPERDSGIASGLASTALQIGTAAGIAVLVGLATANLGGDPSPTRIAEGLQEGLFVMAAGVVLAISAALAVPNHSGSTSETTS